MRKHTIVLLALASTLGACASAVTADGVVRSQAPVAQNFPLTYQGYAQAAEHWQLIARETAKRLHVGYPTFPPSIFIYVVKNDNETPFERAYHNILMAEITNVGIRTAELDSSCRAIGCNNMAFDPNALRLETTVQLVVHDPNRFVRSAPGDYIAGMVGPMAVGFASYGIATAAGIAAGVASGVTMAAIASEIGSGAASGTPNTEILITSLVKRRGVVELATQGAYYVPPREAWHFQLFPSPNRTIEIVGK